MRAVIALPYAWLVVFFLLPFCSSAGHRLRHQRSRCRAADRAWLQPGELQAPVHRRSLPRRVAELAAYRRHRHARHPDPGLPDGLRHRAFAAAPAAGAADAGDLAVLDVVPDPRLCLDGVAGRERHPQPVPALDRYRRRSGHHPWHRMGGAARHRLRLPAVHGAAALRHAGEARSQPARGGGRSRGQAGCRLPDRHPAALPARRPGGLPAGLHPRSR
jgi:hypothetical protein